MEGKTSEPLQTPPELVESLSPNNVTGPERAVNEETKGDITEFQSPITIKEDPSQSSVEHQTDLRQSNRMKSSPTHFASDFGPATKWKNSMVGGTA